MIIRLTDLIKSYMDVGEEAVHSMFLCHHIFHILDNAGVQTTRKKSSEEFYRQWGNKVRGLTEHMDWNSNPYKFCDSTLALIRYFLETHPDITDFTVVP